MSADLPSTTLEFPNPQHNKNKTEDNKKTFIGGGAKRKTVPNH